MLLLLAACGTGGPAGRQASGEKGPARAGLRADTAPDTMAADTTPPVARARMLVTRAASEHGALDGQWRPRAGVCGTPPSLQLLVQGDSVDLLLLVSLPPDSTPSGTYVVGSPADTTGPARAARIGVQQLQPADLAYQGIAGTVRLERLDRAASGTFDVTLQETPSHRTFRFLGVFAAVPVDTLGGAACRPAAPDTADAAVRRKPA